VLVKDGVTGLPSTVTETAFGLMAELPNKAFTLICELGTTEVAACAGTKFRKVGPASGGRPMAVALPPIMMFVHVALAVPLPQRSRMLRLWLVEFRIEDDFHSIIPARYVIRAHDNGVPLA